MQRGREFLVGCRGVAGQQQGCCGAALDVPEFVRVQPAVAEVAEVVAEFLFAAVGVVGAEQQAVGAEGAAGAGEGVGVPETVLEYMLRRPPVILAVLLRVTLASRNGIVPPRAGR